MLLLKEVEEVSVRTNPLQSLDLLEHQVDSALGRHGPLSPQWVYGQMGNCRRS
jgi:hypothetical protein